ncbi:CoA transferase [Phenylobacterium sp.]|uniref:CaiB/BaiF CoA transferase family protein n=1 Tax=Phenylobacterium sp. TaxID=1871053 RepID=UPI0025F3E20D|nr:CoA transferase [Phenylobacterium sp.]
MGPEGQSRRPLDGIRVVDFTSMVAGPWTTRMLADVGAEVIKVEAVGEGDLMRFTAPVNAGKSRVYAHYNCGKQSISLNLKTEAGREVARRLMQGADVVVENFRPGVMARLELDYETARKDNPKLVYCSVSGFGQNGPRAGQAAYAPVVHACSGYDHVQAVAQGGDGSPLNSGVMIADVVAGSYAFGAIQTALLHRERNGVGSHVDVTLIESMMSLVAIQFQEAQCDTRIASRVFAPLKTADGHIMVPLVSPKTYLGVYAVIGRADWLADPVFASMAGIMGHQAEIDAAVGAWAASRATRDCEAALNAAGVPCSVYSAPADVLDDPHLVERGVFASQEDAVGPFTVLNAPFRISGTDCGARAGVSRSGEDTADVVARTLGLGEDEYRRLRDAQAFG